MRCWLPFSSLISGRDFWEKNIVFTVYVFSFPIVVCDRHWSLPRIQIAKASCFSGPLICSSSILILVTTMLNRVVKNNTSTFSVTETDGISEFYAPKCIPNEQRLLSENNIHADFPIVLDPIQAGTLPATYKIYTCFIQNYYIIVPA